MPVTMCVGEGKGYQSLCVQEEGKGYQSLCV